MTCKRAVSAILLGLVSACGGGGDGEGDGPGHDVTVEIYRGFPFVDGNTGDEAQFVAVQDGDGPFVEATGSNGLYTVHIDSDKFGVAVGCVDEVGAFVDIEIIQQTAEDGLTYQTFCKSRAPDATLDVIVTNLPPGQTLRLRTNRGAANASTDGTASMLLPSGETELFGTLTDENRNVLQFFRIPSIDVEGTTTVAIDVLTDGIPPATGVFSLTPDEETARIRTSVVRPYGSVALTNLTNPIGTSRDYLKLDRVMEESDDLYRIAVFGGTGSATQTAKQPGTLAFELPEQFVAPNPELLVTPILRPVFTFDPTPAVLPNQSYFLEADNFAATDTTVLRAWFVTISSGWIGDATTVRYEFPDFSAMSGFADVALVEDERLDTLIQRVETSADFNVDGAQSTSSTSFGVLGKFCGDGEVIAPETCDPGEDFETEVCDTDCTMAECGDGVVNFAAGEDCDPPDGATCSPQCTLI